MRGRAALPLWLALAGAAIVTGPASTRTSVDLPAPFGPITATISPGAAASATSRRPGTSRRASRPAFVVLDRVLDGLLTVLHD